MGILSMLKQTYRELKDDGIIDMFNVLDAMESKDSKEKRKLVRRIVEEQLSGCKLVSNLQHYATAVYQRKGYVFNYQYSQQSASYSLGLAKHAPDKYDYAYEYIPNMVKIILELEKHGFPLDSDVKNFNGVNLKGQDLSPIRERITVYSSRIFNNHEDELSFFDDYVTHQALGANYFTAFISGVGVEKLELEGSYNPHDDRYDDELPEMTFTIPSLADSFKT